MVRFVKGIFSVVGMSFVVISAVPVVANERVSPGATPFVELSAYNDDNVSRAPGDEDVVESWVTSLSAGIDAIVMPGKHRINLRGQAERNEFSDFHQNDHTNHLLKADATLALAKRHEIRWALEYRERQDAIDSVNRRDPAETAGNRWSNWSADFEYRLGQPAAKISSVWSARYSELRYENNLDTASLNRAKERDVSTADGSVYIKIAPKTRLVGQYIYSDVAYVEDQRQLSGDSRRALIGLTWDASAKTSGNLRVGWEVKDFDSVSLDRAELLAWQVSLSWAPKSYSKFILSSRQSIEEGSAQENFVEQARTQVSWKHDWGNGLATDIGVNYQDKRYEGGINDGRNDDVWGGSAELSKVLSKRVVGTLFYRYSDVDSSSSVDAYQRDVFGLGLKARL